MSVAAVPNLNKLYPRQTALVCSQHAGRQSIITIDWHMPASFQPFLVAICIGKTRFSHELISNSKEFVFSVPSFSMAGAALYCGSHSGRDVADKWRASGLSPIASEQVKAPGIREAICNLECKVLRECDAGDHTIFIGEVVQVHENADAAAQKKIIDRGNRELEPL